MPPRAERLAYHGPAKMPCQTTDMRARARARRLGTPRLLNARARCAASWLLLLTVL